MDTPITADSVREGLAAFRAKKAAAEALAAADAKTVADERLPFIRSSLHAYIVAHLDTRDSGVANYVLDAVDMHGDSGAAVYAQKYHAAVPLVAAALASELNVAAEGACTPRKIDHAWLLAVDLGKLAAPPQ